MEEELNEDELEERLYAKIHHADDTQPAAQPVTSVWHNTTNAANTPRQQQYIRRYWHTSDDAPQHHTPFQKINQQNTIQSSSGNKTNFTKPKEEKNNTNIPETPLDVSIFQTPISNNVQRTIQILENGDRPIVELESSDEDEVIEVTVPPKPTITIESSDEDDLEILTEHSPAKTSPIGAKKRNSKRKGDGDREVSASPVPSVVSSVSDEFIRSDCIALNISSRCSDQPSFDFSLHGTDLLGQNTQAKKKKKKKNKDKNTSTPTVLTNTTPEKVNNTEEYFATPKSKSGRNKRQRNKSSVSATELRTPQLYDSDNGSNKNHYTVSEKGIPNADVYESDSNQSVAMEPKESDKLPEANNTARDANLYNTTDTNKPINSLTQLEHADAAPNKENIIDLTYDPNSLLTHNVIPIDDNLTINVTGLDEPEEFPNIVLPHDIYPKLGSTKVPAILSEDVDFDNLKGKNIVSNRRYSLTTLRAEMEKFYNESWGGEDFNHREIQKTMSRDKSLWMIDPKDRMQTPSKKKIRCGFCNRTGHRENNCYVKPPVCHMCGTPGHYEPRCPRKICVNCGSPNLMYSTVCRNCSGWERITCPECGQNGHPYSHCPDIWRRYHNTIGNNTPLEENRQTRKYYQMYCSGCARRGHLVHSCRLSLPFSGLPINSPYVALYRPFYPHIPNNDTNPDTDFTKDISDVSPQHMPKLATKRHSKSPTAHDSHINKRRNTGSNEENIKNNNSRKSSLCVANIDKMNQQKLFTIVQSPKPNDTKKATEPMPDYIPIVSSNHDDKGQVIQDNEVSDTSDVVTIARIYITKDIVDRLSSTEGGEWLNSTMKSCNVTVTFSDVNSYLSVQGNVGDQEAFQNELRTWAQTLNKEGSKSNDKLSTSRDNELSFNIPKNRNDALRKLNRAFATLKQDLGDPNKMFKELTYLQNHHNELLNQKVISSKQVSNNRDNLNEMLKKLNMVLVGQAGLADGHRHLTQLYTIQGKLANYRQKNISRQLRHEIGQHYHTIFTATPRDDYRELLQKYYTRNKNNQLIFKKKKKNETSFRLNPRTGQTKQSNKKLHMTRTTIEKHGQNSTEKLGATQETGTQLMVKTMNKLIYYHRRLSRARSSDAGINKTRLELVRKLHSHISTLGGNAQLSSKAMKKIMKVQEQAQLFLTNNV